MTWEKIIFDAVKELCLAKGTPYFEIKEIYAYEDKFRKHYPDNNFIPDKIRQQLHYLDKKKKIVLLNKKGRYKLKRFLQIENNKDHPYPE